jgi:hypothetical protein
VNPAIAYTGPITSFAYNTLLDSIRGALTRGPQTSETIVFLVGLVAFVLLIILAARFYGKEGRAGDHPRVDYLTLAVDLLGLSESDRRDLKRIARLSGMDQPAAILLSPANFALAAAPALRVGTDRELRQRLEGLCVRLFDAPLPEIN